MKNKILYTHTILVIAIAVITFVAFLPALDNEFINFDEPNYIQHNATIKSLSKENIEKIFSSYVNRNYQPLTIFSFALEYKSANLSPLSYHLTNINLHLGNCVLVYIFIFLLTRNYVAAFIAALFFGIHPTRVESVAWATERKDVLFLFFYLIGLIVYYNYISADKFRIKYLMAAFLLFVLAALSKVAAISFPFALILLDYYKGRSLLSKRAIFEKLPFFGLSFILGIIAVYGYYALSNTSFPVIDAFMIAKAHASYTPELLFSYNFIDKIFLTSYALLLYILKFFFPFRLSLLYPLPGKAAGLLPIEYYLGTIFLSVIILWSVKLLKKQKYFMFGILLFISTLIFNLPITYTFHAIIADRFTYLPYIGLFVILGTSISLFIDKHKSSKGIRSLTCVLLALVVIIFSAQTWNRCKVWKNSYTLWNDVISKYPSQAIPYHGRGNYFYENRQWDLAIKDFNRAIKFNPKDYNSYNHRGNAHALKGDYQNALNDYNQAIKINPRLLSAYFNRADNYIDMNNLDRATKDIQVIQQINPRHEGLPQLINKLGKN